MWYGFFALIIVLWIFGSDFFWNMIDEGINNIVWKIGHRKDAKDVKDVKISPADERQKAVEKMRETEFYAEVVKKLTYYVRGYLTFEIRSGKKDLDGKMYVMPPKIVLYNWGMEVSENKITFSSLGYRDLWYDERYILSEALQANGYEDKHDYHAIARYGIEKDELYPIYSYWKPTIEEISARYS